MSESKRKSSAELPEVAELELILEREAKRPVPPERASAHFAEFDLVIRWLEILGLSSAAFREDISWRDFLRSNSTIPSLVAERTLAEARKDNRELLSVLKAASDYLGEEDVPQAADAIFVFGSKSLSRIETAVSLWKRGLAPVIFVSGGAPVYEEREKPEAIVYKEWAVAHGVPETAIAIHPTAITVVDNVRGGLNEMDKLGIKHDTLVLVTTWFAMRRSWAVMRKHTSESTKLYRVSASASGTAYDRDAWWKSENGIKVVFNEFVKLRISELLNSS